MNELERDQTERELRLQDIALQRYIERQLEFNAAITDAVKAYRMWLVVLTGISVGTSVGLIALAMRGVL